MIVAREYPKIIQGGMGVSVSNWRLAKSVSECGQLGVVSGTMLDTVIARRLQDGDRDGSVRRALAHFPAPEVAARIVEFYFVEGGKCEEMPYRSVPMHSLKSATFLTDLTVAANFVEVFLAKEGHQGLVGINYLTKIELPTLPSLYGAMLAGVDYVLMGAGIPRSIPGILDRLSQNQPVTLKIDVTGALPEDKFEKSFDPSPYKNREPALKRPLFLAIVSSSTLAQALAKKASGKVDGFVVEHHTAGGHNAPPRGPLHLSEQGEPIYGPKDEADLSEFIKLGLPFWLAGSCASPESLKAALTAGAQGIQVGTSFAYCQESGITEDIKEQIIAKILDHSAEVFTDPRASASGYPFKVVQLEGSLWEQEEFERRTRICDLGYLRTPSRGANGAVVFRCPAEPVDDYVKKGGAAEETEGRKCLCNGLMSTVGLPQAREGGYLEPALVTAGNELSSIVKFLAPNQKSYSAKQVIAVLLEGATCKNEPG